MKPDHATAGYTLLAVLTVAGLAFAVPGVAADDGERESRRLEAEARWVQEQGRREIENREWTQAEALRSQQDAIRRMEDTQARIQANTPQTVQPPIDQSRVYIYERNNLPAPQPASPGAANDPVNGMTFASLSEQLGTYFGTQSGVLVVRTGTPAPFGLQDGDVILSIDGRVPADGPHAASILRSYKPGERVKLRVQRNRQSIAIDTAR